MSNSNGEKITIRFGKYGEVRREVEKDATFEELLQHICNASVDSKLMSSMSRFPHDCLCIDGKLYDIPNTQLSGKRLDQIPIKDGSLLYWHFKEIDVIPQINIRSANIHQTASPSSNRMKTPFKTACNRYYKNRHDNYFFRFKNKDCRLNRIYIPHPTYIQRSKNYITQTSIPIAPIQVKPHVINNSLAVYRPKYYSANLSSRRYK